ncbi:MAG: hypothetical protein HYZ17_17305 [Betaproteobacteria bacterium]|nr:hypothetical protein [Betaproteobacteria bacterium]
MAERCLRRAGPALFLALLAGGCAAPVPRVPANLQFGPTELPPQGFHQRCLALRATERLNYQFTADPPLALVIEYRSGNMALQPVHLPPSAAEAGRFLPDASRDYCLRWENPSNFPALLRYRLDPR